MMVSFLYSMSYIFVNMGATFDRGEPVYAGMDWESPVGVILPLGVVVLGLVIFGI